MALNAPEKEYATILTELCIGQDSAIEKYAKVRFTEYEIGLWYVHGLPLTEVSNQAKAYFSKRFLNGKHIDEVDKKTMTLAWYQLTCAVGEASKLVTAYRNMGVEVRVSTSAQTGCRQRCRRLVDKLNGVLLAHGCRIVQEPDKFLDWLTFDYTLRRDPFYGTVLNEGNTSVTAKIFHDKENRTKFAAEAAKAIEAGEIVSMQDLYLRAFPPHKKT